MRKAVLVAALGLLLAGCGSYSDFVLPSPEAGPAAGRPEWSLRAEPVLTHGAPGDWDGVDALNPSVVRRGDLYYNFYSGYDGRCWRTGLATSPDGIAWAKQGVVLSPNASTWEGNSIAANGSALEVNGEFFYWYQAGVPPRIGLARSRNGRNWHKLPEPVLKTGPRGSWDEKGVADPYVIRVRGNFYLYYLGQDRARRQRLGVAVSADGVEWSKLRSNPILELGGEGAFDEIGLGEPAVWISNGRYWMLYTGRDRREYRALGLASSPNGVAWRRVSGTAVLRGSRPWDSKVVCDPSVEVTADGIRVWFGGGDRPRPAENLDGQIGFGILRFKNDNLAE